MTDSVNILSIETATSACSVALSVDDTVFECSEVGNNIHSKCLLAMVEKVLTEAKLSVSDLSAVAVGQGPGSFTGLRIGIGVAQGIAYGADCSMIGISSLAALAQQGQGNGYVVAGIDARMNEIYWGVYKVFAGKIQLIDDLNVSSPCEIDLARLRESGIDTNNDKVLLAGNAWSEYQEALDQELLAQLEYINGSTYPHAKEILLLAQQAYQREDFISPIDFSPQYVRNDVAVKKTN